MHITKHESLLPELHWFTALLAGAVVGPLLWFGWLYPLVPKTFAGWLAGTGAGVFVGLWATVSALLIGWLQRQTRYRFLCRAIGAIVAVSLGAGIFWLALKGQAFIVANFSYFGR